MVRVYREEGLRKIGIGYREPSSGGGKDGTPWRLYIKTGIQWTGRLDLGSPSRTPRGSRTVCHTLQRLTYSPTYCSHTPGVLGIRTSQPLSDLIPQTRLHPPRPVFTSPPQVDVGHWGSVSVCMGDGVVRSSRLGGREGTWGTGGRDGPGDT